MDTASHAPAARVATATPEAPRRPSAGPAPRATVERFESLDGLRGLAALIVVFHHSVLSLHVADEALGGPAPVGSAAWWLTYTPLHAFWAGEEVVLVFFVLSGFVLTLPATVKALAWRAYYVKRLIRIYVPVWASLVVALVLAELTRTQPSPERSDYVNARADVSLLEAPRDALLVSGAGLLNGPLWSLQWEIIFSLALPLYLLLAYPLSAVRHRAAGLLVAAGLIALIAVGTALESSALRFLPMFGIGVLMAFERDRLAALADALGRLPRPRLTWAALGGVCLLLITGRWTAAGLAPDLPLVGAAGSAASFLGACLAVLLALSWPGAIAQLKRPSWQWLGTVSFSLYVSHEPIVVAIALLLPAAVAGWMTPVLALPLSLLGALAFHRAVEGPAHRLSRAAGKAIGRPRAARSGA